MPDGWQWDSTLFRGSAAYYGPGRLPYAPGFAQTLATALGLDPPTEIMTWRKPYGGQ
ncbi:hypothetical protein [Micromonospora pisi]|uniref:hypothetical protein n=1 Tax=Micromonospora pisi TaxID=589240 RepID=UPI001FE84EEA|nr:hypothetical protein [Micromonospora pisi]